MTKSYDHTFTLIGGSKVCKLFWPRRFITKISHGRNNFLRNEDFFSVQDFVEKWLLSRVVRSKVADFGGFAFSQMSRQLSIGSIESIIGKA